MKEKDKLKVYLEIEQDNGMRRAIFKYIDIEEVLENPEVIKEVVRECEESLRWYKIIKKMENEK